MTAPPERAAASAEPDELRLAAWRGLLNCHAAAVGAIERELAAERLIPLTWYDVLVALWEAPARRLRLHELAERVVLSRSGLTRLVDRLETAGLLRREPCPEDRRGAYAALTPEGEATLRRTWPAYARGIAEHFARHLDASEARALVAAFDRILAGERARPGNRVLGEDATAGPDGAGVRPGGTDRRSAGAGATGRGCGQPAAGPEDGR